MHIITTIYCTDLKLNQRNAQDAANDATLQFATSEPDDLSREFLSVYQGENPMGPLEPNV
jgi:hypothetical protein